ncbi:MAG: (Fe-S)-binding protein [Acidobacteriota bacterium]
MSSERTVEIATTSLQNALAGEMEKITGCIHCGLCLPVCPTYNQGGNENDSPRGRIYLMRAVAEGRLGIDSPTLSRHIDLCLGCRACETACPAGVRYGNMLEAARESISEHGVTGPPTSADVQKSMLGLALRHVFPHPRRLAAVLSISRLLRDSFLTRFALTSGLVRRISASADFALSLLASTAPLPWRRGQTKAEVDPQRVALPPTAERAPVAVFTGCVMEGLFTDTNRATTRVLAVNGCQPVDVPTQVCCGALHAHSGDLTTARELARRNIDAFEQFLASSAADRPTPTIVINAAGCGALLKEYGELLHDDPAYAERANRFSRAVLDVTEVLARGEIRRGAEVSQRVTFDAPCHLYHAQRVQTAPQKVLASIPGLEYRPLEGMQDCCGGAGIYNLSEPEMSGAILTEKIDRVKATGAQLLATANPGCQMQLSAGVRLHGAECEVVHLVDLLDESYRRAGFYRESN